MIKIDICCFNITNIAIPQFMSQFSRNELGLFNIITRPFKNSQIDNSNNNDNNNNDSINTTTSTLIVIIIKIIVIIIIIYSKLACTKAILLINAN